MHGLVLEGVGRVVHRTDVSDPVVTAPTDAVVAVRRAGLCGSDLHPFAGREVVRSGVVCGHEAVGDVVAIGDEVAVFAVGDRVLVPFTTSCGVCGPCRRGVTARCVRGQLFGFGSAEDVTAPALHGCQAEYVRVPLADTTLVAVPDDVDDVAAVLLTDTLPTGWCAVQRAEPIAVGALVVVGLGAVGLCAVAAAVHGASGSVLGVDPVAERRAAAARLGAAVAAPADAAGAVADATDGEGAPSVVEAAGTTEGQHLAFSLVRPGGVLSVISVHTADSFGFSPIEAYDANITLRFGRASVRAALPRLLPDRGALLPPLADVVITHPHVDLADGPTVYARFAERRGGIVKAVFAP
jgi:alcohol dehydrogenase